MISSTLLPVQICPQIQQLPSWIGKWLPAWAGPSFLFLGMVLIFGSVLVRLFPELKQDIFPMGFRYIVAFSFTLGVLFSIIGGLRKHELFFLYIAMLFGLATALQSAATAGMIVKLYLLYAEGRWDFTGQFRKKLPKRLARIFLLFSAVTLAIRIIVVGPFFRDRLYDLLIIWTLFNFGSAVIGATWNLRRLKGVYRVHLLAGLILSFAAVQIINLNCAQDVVLQAIAAIFGILGFGVAILFAYWEIRKYESSSDTRLNLQ